MMGKAAKVNRFVRISAVDGSDDRMRPTAASTYCRVWNMSTFQLKNRSTSAEPRLVIDRTDSRPGTLLTASSTGRVIVTIIWSIGITPLSIPITMRGKFVSGKTEIGMVKARYPPIRASVIITKMIDLE